MFGFVKKILGGSPSDTEEREVVLEISAEDLDAPDVIGPKIATYAMMREDIEGADYDAGVVRLRYHSGGDMVLDLANVLPFMRRAPDGQAMIDYLDSVLTEPADADDGYLLPVLKGPDYVETAMRQLREAGAPADQPAPFWAQPLQTGLTVILVHDTPQMMRSVSEAELLADGLDTDMAHQRAMQDLARFCHERDLQVGSADGKLFQVQLDGNYEASTYFLSSIWDDIAEEFGAPPAALFAARNIVIYANSGDAEAMRLLEIVAAPRAEQPAYAIAPEQILIWGDDGWTPYQPGPQSQDRPN